MKKKNSFRIGRTSPLAPAMFPTSVAANAKKALDTIAPLAAKTQMPPMRALVLAAIFMDAYETGKQRYLTEKEMYGICLIIMKCWERKLFTLTAIYPYTYEQTHAAWTSEEREVQE